MEQLPAPQIRLANGILRMDNFSDYPEGTVITVVTSSGTTYEDCNVNGTTVECKGSIVGLWGGSLTLTVECEGYESNSATVSA